MKIDLNVLPKDLPVPVNDGLAEHLVGMALPPLKLRATNGELVELTKLTGKVVIYVYPLTGHPESGLPSHWHWEQIPGARGCTPQACNFRDHYQELKTLNVEVFGLSAQATEYQLEVKSRLHLPFDLLSDVQFSLKSTLNLPTFTVDANVFYKRLTMIIEHNCIIKVFYPVFPPNENATQVLEWLKLDE